MPPNETQGIVNAVLVYLVLGGIGTAVAVFLIRRFVGDPAIQRTAIIALALGFTLGLGAWIWFIRDLQQSLNP